MRRLRNLLRGIAHAPTAWSSGAVRRWTTGWTGCLRRRRPPGLSVEEVADTLLGRMAPDYADDVALVVSRVVPGIVRG
ncbi:hypothetical protein ABC795_10100 [Blastococcus sp. HT6-30]|uniref:hypothetical protein n=1 Tax=Blastococcus sp. HT6-30 TaxID=3144843 RepID=UPI003219FDD7